MPNYDNYDYNTMGFGNDPLKNGSENAEINTDNGILGFVDDMVGNALFGDVDASSKIFGELTGYNKQQREFAQQEYMQDKIWQHDSAAAQMARAKAAGINLNTAAAGVVGSGNSSTVSVPSGGGSPSAAVDSVAGVVGALSNSQLNAASAENQTAQAENTRMNTKFVPLLANGQNMKYFGDFVQGMKDVGLAEINAGGIAFDIISGGLHKALDYLSYCSGLRNVDTQMKYVKAQYEVMKKEADYGYDLKLNSTLSLQDRQGLAAAARAAKDKADAWYQEQKNSIEASLKGSTMLQGESYLNWVAWEYGVDSPQFGAAEKGFYNYAYQSNLGQFAAEVDTMYDKIFESAKAQKDVDAQFAQFFADIENHKDLVKQLIELRYSAGSGMTSLLDRLISEINGAFDGYLQRKDLGKVGVAPAAGSGLPHYNEMHSRK